MKAQLTIKGVRQVSEAFTFLDKASTKAAKKAVSAWLEVVATESQQLVPRITGKLARSLRKTVRERPAVFGTLEYLATYAIYVHEIPRPPSSTGFHKFLERPWKRNAPDLRDRISEAVAEAIEQAGKIARGGR